MDYSQFKNVDVISGGFPCQAFSYAGKSLGFDDPRGGLIFEMFRCLQELQPKVMVAENVCGLRTHQRGETLREIMRGLEKCGYNTFIQTVNALHYDVPQKRHRLLIVGLRKDLGDSLPTFPQPSRMRQTLKDALKNCPESNGIAYSKAKHKVMKQVPEGGCWVDLPDKVQRQYMGSAYGNRLGGRRGMARRLAWNEPSLTILCSPSQKQTERCHPTETRPLTVRECMRIQTFPDSWEIEGGATAQYRQIGNAVPVNLGKIIGQHIKAVLRGTNHAIANR